MNKRFLTLLISCFCLALLTTACETTTTAEEKPVESTETTTSPIQNSKVNLVVQTDDTGTLDSIQNKNSAAYERVQFHSLDSLLIDANYYAASPTAPSILLCHQARWNKYEYDSIAVVLQKKGYNCLATDQRSGGVMTLDGIQPINATYKRAIAAGLPTEYLDAEQDILAAINYLHHKTQGPIIIWGSSYSSTLALYNGLNNDKVAAVISFSPGNYFSDQKGSLIPLIAASTTPFFITSSKKEAKDIKALIQNKVLSKQQVQFIPTADGFHGSRALWASKTGNEEYWTAIMSFLESLN
ncbi:MAG: dienelactone hydrolase [Aureispira sp.]|jgi:dienelactone hydrolase